MKGNDLQVIIRKWSQNTGTCLEYRCYRSNLHRGQSSQRFEDSKVTMKDEEGQNMNQGRA